MLENHNESDVNYFTCIAERATTLRDKIDHPEAFIFSPAEEHKTAALLAEWQNAVAPGDPEKFARRLTNDWLDETRLADLAGHISFKNESFFPAWIKEFKKITGFLAGYDPDASSIAWMASKTFLLVINKDKQRLAVLYNNMGSVYKQLSYYEKANFYFLASAKLKEELSDSAGLAASYNNIGLIYKDWEIPKWRGNTSEWPSASIGKEETIKALASITQVWAIFSSV